MNDYSLAILVGTLKADPRLEYDKPAGIPFVRMPIRVRRSELAAETGERKTTELTVAVVAWRRLAELCAQFLKKGRTVMVVGKLTGKGARMSIEADRVQFLGPKETAGQPSAAEAK